MTTSQQPENILSPCVRNCCLNEQDICMGCFRHLSEITAWQGLSTDARQQVIQLCYERSAIDKLNKKAQLGISR